MHLKGYDAWKTRNGLDEVLRRLADERERCFVCDAPLPEAPWSFWCSDGVNASLCDDCAPKETPSTPPR